MSEYRMMHSFKQLRGTLACALIAATLAAVACNKQNEAPTAGLQKLADAFQRANQADSIEPMLALYCLDGVSDTTLTRLKGALEFELGIPIRSIHFEPLTGAPEECIKFVHNNVTYGPSLTPGYRMRVTYEQDDDLTSLFTVGRNCDGAWKIVCARPQKTRDNSLTYTPALR